MVTVVLALPSTKPYLAAILLAALVIWLLVADLSTANSAAAVAAAVSAAPCIVRFVRYQLAASVPSPANPTMMERASAMITALAPLRSMRGPAASCHARWESTRRCALCSLLYSSRATLVWRRRVTGIRRQDDGQICPWDV
jgi:hypothetical protein